MKGLPDISEQVSQVLQHYIESITTTYPDTNDVDADKYATEFARLWIQLQFENGRTKYYGKMHKS